MYSEIRVPTYTYVLYIITVMQVVWCCGFVLEVDSPAPVEMETE